MPRCARWRHILEGKGGRAPQWDFINGIQMMAMSGRATVLGPIEILAEWQEAAWIEYSPDGSEIRITPAGIAKLKEWEEERP